MDCVVGGQHSDDLLSRSYPQVTISKEGTSGEVGLEAGALVLSDQVCV